MVWMIIIYNHQSSLHFWENLLNKERKLCYVKSGNGGEGYLYLAESLLYSTWSKCPYSLRSY